MRKLAHVAGFSRDRVGVVVLRVWIERDANGLRARITQVGDIEHPEEVVVFASDVDEICRILREFIDSFVGDASVTSQ